MGFEYTHYYKIKNKTRLKKQLKYGHCNVNFIINVEIWKHIKVKCVKCLPGGNTETTWIKYVPKKINVFY